MFLLCFPTVCVCYISPGNIQSARLPHRSFLFALVYHLCFCAEDIHPESQETDQAGPSVQQQQSILSNIPASREAREEEVHFIFETTYWPTGSLSVEQGSYYWHLSGESLSKSSCSTCQAILASMACILLTGSFNTQNAYYCEWGAPWYQIEVDVLI